MESRKLQIILHSGKDLTDVKHFGTMDPYALVWIAGENGKQSRPHKTKIATKGASCPVWDCPMEFKVASTHKNCTLFCQIMHAGKLFDRKIGEVQVPFIDLLAGDASGKNVSYAVKNVSGEVKGEIIISHKFSEPVVKSGKKDGTQTSTAKVAGGQRKKVQPKKKNGMMKRVAKNVVTKVATEAVLLAGTVGLVFALDLDVEDTNEDEDGDGDEEGDVDEDVDAEEDEYVDQDEDEDEDDMEF